MTPDALDDLGAKFALQPDMLLAPDGVRRDVVLYVENGRIASIGDPDTGHPVGMPALRLPGCAIVAGFVDAHSHLGQTFGKAFVFGEPSQIWQRIWGPLEASLSPELVEVSATWMCLEALRGGFTTIVNFAMGDEDRTAAFHAAAAKTGMRIVSCAGASDLADYRLPPDTTPKISTIDEALRRAERHLAMCRGFARVSPSLCCSGIQGATDTLIKEMAAFSARHGALFQFHSNEHFPEIHGSILRYGMRPIEFLANRGVLGRHVLLHHCTLVDEHEIELLAESGTGVSYNPVASVWKGDGVAPAMSFIARGVRFGLGTDSTRSNALRLLDAAETCQRLTYGMPKLDFSCGAGWRWVEAATRGSADVAGLGEVTGALAEGMAADFLVLDMRRPETLPSWDFEWELVRLYDREQIDAVFIDGRLVLRRGKAIGWDAETFLSEELTPAVVAVSGSKAIRVHGPSADHRPPG